LKQQLLVLNHKLFAQRSMRSTRYFLLKKQLPATTCSASCSPH